MVGIGVRMGHRGDKRSSSQPVAVVRFMWADGENDQYEPGQMITT